MHPLQLKKLILEGESSQVEFKRKVSKPVKIAKEMSAFANSKGGFLLVGVDDDRSVVGVRSEKSEIDLLETAAAFYVEPEIPVDIEVVNYKGKDVVVARIEEGERKPYKVVFEDKYSKEKKKRAYIRVGEASMTASSEMTRFLSTLNPDSPPVSLVVGEIEKRLFTFLDQYQRATVKDFTAICNISRRRAERLLIRLVKAGVLQIHSDSTSDFFTYA